MLQPRNGGSIIFTSTFVGYTAGIPGTAAYAASKAGNHRPDPGPCRRARPEGHTSERHLARRHRYAAGSDHDQHPEALTYVEGVHAFKRLASLDEIARSVLYLASDASSFASVAAILVD